MRISFDALEAYRTRLMGEVQRITEVEQLRGPRELGAAIEATSDSRGGRAVRRRTRCLRSFSAQRC